MFVPLFLLTASCASSGGDTAPIRYQSPTAVFNAYREAGGKRDWRKCFACLTPEAQKETVFEVFFSCTMSSSEESRAIVKKYVDGAAANDEFQKKYRKKHGIDIAKLVEGRENDPTFRPPPPDRDLLRDAVAAHVKDKAGFYEAATDLFVKTAVSPLGDLEDLTVHDDTATGRAKRTIVPTPGESPPAVDKIDKTLKFRRVNGGWLLDSL